MVVVLVLISDCYLVLMSEIDALYYASCNSSYWNNKPKWW